MGKILELEEQIKYLKEENEILKKVLRAYLMEEHRPLLKKMAQDNDNNWMRYIE